MRLKIANTPDEAARLLAEFGLGPRPRAGLIVVGQPGAGNARDRVVEPKTRDAVEWPRLGPPRHDDVASVYFLSVLQRLSHGDGIEQQRVARWVSIVAVFLGRRTARSTRPAGCPGAARWRSGARCESRVEGQLLPGRTR